MYNFKSFLILLIGAILVGCGKDSPKPDPVVSPKPDPVVLPERVIMNTSDSTMAIRSVDSLKASVLPENAADKTLEWSSSDPSVVSVNAKGRIEALKEGSAIITVKARAGGLSISRNLIVESDINRVKGWIALISNNQQNTHDNMVLEVHLKNASNTPLSVRDIEIYHDLNIYQSYPAGTYEQIIPKQSAGKSIYTLLGHSSWLPTLNAKVFFIMNGRNYAMYVYQESYQTEEANDFSVGIDPGWDGETTIEIPSP